MPQRAADRSSFHSQSLGTFDVVPPSAEILADGHQGDSKRPHPLPRRGTHRSESVRHQSTDFTVTLQGDKRSLVQHLHVNGLKRLSHGGGNKEVKNE